MATIRLSIFVSDISGVISAYDVIKIRRSTTDDSGPYTEISGAAKTSAKLLSSSTSPFDVGGKTLTISVDQGAETSILFSGTGNRTVAQVVDDIEAVISGIASNESGYLALESTLDGSRSKIEIVGGSAAAAFGWEAGDSNTGLEQNITLVSDVNDYTFIDYDGDEDYWYQAAYLNTTTSQQSSWSSSFKGDAGTVITAENRSTATVDLVDATGAAVPGQRITFYSQHTPLQVEGYQAALVRQPVTITTDNVGHAEVSLIRGLILRVVFEGTSLIREITVPDQASFDLLELMASAPDPYNPVDPEIPYAIRRTL